MNRGLPLDVIKFHLQAYGVFLMLLMALLFVVQSDCKFSPDIIRHADLLIWMLIALLSLRMHHYRAPDITELVMARFEVGMRAKY